MKTIIHVNQHVIKSNTKTGERQPPLTVKTYKENRKTSKAQIVVDGRVVAQIVYSPDSPLSCGARVWIETAEEVLVSTD
jgi:hypothetical protein